MAPVEERFGGLDVLRLRTRASSSPAAATAPSPRLEEDAWQRTLDVNLKSVYLGAPLRDPGPAAARRRRDRQRRVGRRLRVGSGASDAYTAAKGGVLAITAHARRRARPGDPRQRRRAGPIATPMTAGAPDENFGALEAMVPLGRLGPPRGGRRHDVFLASDAASFCTGQTYVVDGGYMAK